MADGEVLINTKINTDGAKEDLKKLKQELSDSANTASDSAKKIDDSFENVDVSDAADGLGEAFEKEADRAEQAVEELARELPESYRTVYDKISQIQADGTLSNQDKVDKIREQYEALGQDQETAMRKAWDAVKYDSETGSQKVIENLRDIAESAADTGESVEKKVGDAFGNLAKKIGSGLAAAFAVDKIVEFGKVAVELGSDLEEVQNVVDVTFTTMSDRVNAFARDAAAMAGLSETMAKQFVGTFGAMADSFGFAEQEAYEMSTTLTKLAGDVASFYNLDQQEAFNKLKAIFTGETEALKELGVVMTQTALDAYAMENGFGKVTSEMTEQEKVALRYQFVLEQLESASGDFMRTQESWANQTRILTLQWESFQATVGEGLIYAFSPAIQYINDTVMPTLQNMAEGFAEAMKPTAAEELGKAIDSMKDSFIDADEQLQNTTAEIEANAVMAQYCADELRKLEEAGLDTVEAQEKYESLVIRLNELIPGLNAKINEQTGLIDKNTDAIYESVEAMKRRAMYEAQQEVVNGLYEGYKTALTEVTKAQYKLTKLESEQASLIKRLATEMGITEEQDRNLAASFWDTHESMTASEFVIENLGGLVPAFGSDLQELERQIGYNNYEMSLLNHEIEASEEALSLADIALTDYSAQMEKSAEDAGIAIEGQEALAESVQDTEKAYDNAKEAAREMLDAQIGLLEEVDEEGKYTGQKIIDIWKNQAEVINKHADNLRKATFMGVSDAIIKQFSDGTLGAMQAFDALINESGLTVTQINQQYEGVEQAKDTLAEVLEGMEKELEDSTVEMVNQINSGLMASELRAELSATRIMQSIDKIEGKDVYIDIYERYRGFDFAQNHNTYGDGMFPSYNALSSLSATAYIPYLAEGAVIPPNAPFTAVLGDQRNGYNLEGPEDMFRGIVREELAAALGEGFDDLLDVSREILSTIEGIEVGDTTIGQANERYVDKMRIVRGR